MSEPKTVSSVRILTQEMFDAASNGQLMFFLEVDAMLKSLRQKAPKGDLRIHLSIEAQ